MSCPDKSATYLEITINISSKSVNGNSLLDVGSAEWNSGLVKLLITSEHAAASFFPHLVS